MVSSFEEDLSNQYNSSPRIQVLELKDKAVGSSIWVIVEREEEYEYITDSSNNKCLFGGNITLYYKILNKKNINEGRSHKFKGYYSSYQNTVGLTSHNFGARALFLEPAILRGKKLGTYLMNEIILWAKRWPDAEVSQIDLFSTQADEKNKERRNRFYEQFGIKFKYETLERADGKSELMFAKDLNCVDSWKKEINIFNIHEFLSEKLNENVLLFSKLEENKRYIKDLTDSIYKAEKNPLKWALKHLWRNYSYLAMIVTVVFLFSFLFGLKFSDMYNNLIGVNLN
nr:hypothetical protein GTC16762_30860 [Pigmentibacter ruber]